MSKKLATIVLLSIALTACGVVFPTQEPTEAATAQPTATTAPPAAATATAQAPEPTSAPAATAQPVGLPPQPQLPHPSEYLETGVGNSKSWTFQLGPNEVLIVGGWSVEGTSGGVYRAWTGGQSVTVSVTDGFALVVAKDWAKAEFCFRVGQAKEFGWAHGTIEPLPGWDACQ